MKSFFQLVGLLLAIVAATDSCAVDVTPYKASSTQKESAAMESMDRPPMPASPPSTGSSTNNTPPIKVSVEPTRKKDSVMPADGKQALLPSVDLPSLEKQLRETDAIGLFTKITLKNQIDDLVNQFREYHGKRREISLAELRQRYDMLLLKLLSLLQDKDPPLAHTIVASRDTIWSMLTDPHKFSTI